MKTLIYTLVTIFGLGLAAPVAEARDNDRGKRYKKSHRHHYRDRDRSRVYYRSAPRYYYSDGYYGRRYYPYRSYPYRSYYRPGGLSFHFQF